MSGTIDTRREAQRKSSAKEKMWKLAAGAQKEK